MYIIILKIIVFLSLDKHKMHCYKQMNIVTGTAVFKHTCTNPTYTRGL